jgi:hypothetical protein
MRRSVLLVLLISACGFRPSEAPISPKVVVGKATVSGRVLDLSNIPVADMRVTCSENDASMVTGTDGKWSLEVPADTSITLRAVPVDPLYVYKDVTFGPFQMSNRAVLENVELLSVPGSTIGGLNAIAGADEVRGVLAVKVISLSGKCTPDDGTVELVQTRTARAVYNLPNTNQPDRNLVKMQPNTHPQAWLAGVAPGTYQGLKFTKPGCKQLPYPVAYRKISWLGGFRLQAKALTQVVLFIE